MKKNSSVLFLIIMGAIWLAGMALLWLGGGALVHWALSAIPWLWVARLLTVVAVVLGLSITVPTTLMWLAIVAKYV
jgi:hypothetical protein